MARKLVIIILSCCVCLLAGAQAGRGVYAFLDLPTSSRMAALGGSNVSVFDHDVNFVFQNPALLSEQTDRVIGLNYANYLADINYGSAVYGLNVGKNYLSVGAQYMDYGKFLEKTENNTNPGGGDEETVFSAQDLAIYASYARPIGKGFTVGATFKPIFSHFETYTSFGFAFDVGASYLSQLTAAQAVPTDGRRLAVQYRYNPTLDYRAYMIPALMTLLLLILCGVLPALNIVSEKEIGTIEQINVTPVGRLAFTMGKLIPFWAIGLVAVGVGIAVGGLVYGVWPAGSLWLILLASLLFTSVVSGFGLVVSNYSTTLRQALFVIYFFVMIFILMGGLFTPVASMPRWAQAVTYALPTRYYGEAMRALYLKGSTIADLLPQFGALALMAAGLGAWAVGSYRKTE